MTVNTATVSFTSREKDVVQGLAEGLTDHAIARRLNRKPSTVRHYIATAMKKVGANRQAALVNYAYDLGLIRPPVREDSTAYVSPQQRELIPLIVRGLTLDQIAAETHTTSARARRDVRRLMKALDAETRAHVVTRARQYGLLKAARPPRAVGRT
ncbi:LuxR C-terminal-related transcriptional regulator [Streptomyces lasiicapitis]|uniref:helix-turn-helix domain-containing protein n=1 Tax=Streptomyces lasiicapitis TaxID=1923961 RepID=UPI00333047BF